MESCEKIIFSPIEESLPKYLKDKKSDFIFITHPSLFEIFKEKLLKIFKKIDKRMEIVLFEEGEKNKTRQVKEKIEDEIFEKGFLKDACIIAFGGGVVLDMAGFVAATYLRGISSIFIPTTLLSMCDASIGGKCAVNTKFGKNQIGTFHKNEAVFIDTFFLSTLSENEIKNGLVELVKHFLLLDKDMFFSFVKEKNIYGNLLYYLKKSIAIKQKIVSQDRFEKNYRQILNLGHSMAHALESFYGFNISHGQAVAMGIVIEAVLSHQMGFLSSFSLHVIMDAFSKFFPKRKLAISKEKILLYMLRDKKNRGKNIHVVLLEDIGKVQLHEKFVSHPVDKKQIIAALSEFEEIISCLYAQ